MFSDEAIFYAAGRVHGPSVNIWSTENPHVLRVHICDSPKVNVMFGPMRNRVTSLLFPTSNYQYEYIPGHGAALCGTSD